jgi:hypothetical protein
MVEAEAGIDRGASSALRPLVVGTRPFPGECLSSLLVRACEANIFAKPSHVLSLVGLRAQASEFAAFTHASAVRDIAKLLGSSFAEIEKLMHSPMEDHLGRSSVHWFGDSIERRHIEAKARRFAPHSLEECQHHPAFWTLRLLDYCPLTMEILVSECPQCSRQLGWRACRSLSKCEKCGASLLSAESTMLPPHLREDARLGAALVSPVAAVRQAALSSLPKPFSTWTPADALLGLLTLGEAQLSLQLCSNSSRPASAVCISAGIAFARDWPDSLSRFAKASTIRSNSTSVRVGLGSLGRLFDSAAKKTPIRELIRSTISTSLGEAVVPNKLFPGAIVDASSRAGMLSARQAEQHLGISRKSLRRLERRSDTFLARHHVRGGAALYDQAAISRLAEVLSISERPNDCARKLGIPRYCVEAFTLAGLIEVVTEPDAMIVTGGVLISRESIIDLRERLQEQSTLFDGGATLRDAMRRNGDPHDWVAVFEKMLSGHVRLRMADPGGESISDALVVSAADVASYVSRRTAGPGISGINISCQTAAEIIGTTPQFISAAVRTRFLNGEVRTRTYELPLESVLHFQRDFVLTEELCDLVGGNRKLIGAQLRDAGYEPAAVISRTRVWRRPDIEKYIRERR